LCWGWDQRLRGFLSRRSSRRVIIFIEFETHASWELAINIFKLVVRRVARAAVSLVGAVLCAGSGLAEDQTQAEDQGSIDACRRQLLLIYDAAQSYRRAYGKWPARLSDLAGRFLAPEVLICPECKRQRVFRARDQELLSILDSDSQTVYKWELNTLLGCPGIEGRKWLEWKLQQRKTPVGDAVPIVRCDQHGPGGEKVHLNLTFGGDVFISRASWEEEFRDVLATPYLMTPKQVFADVRPIPERVPPRPPGAGPNQIDLGPLATALPGDPWQDGTSEDSLAGLIGSVGANGLWAHGGVEFDVRALIQLDGRKKKAGEDESGRADWFYPTKPVTVPIGQAARRLHVLGGVIFRSPDGAEVAGLSVKFAGGNVQVIPWRYGYQVRDGWHDQSTGAEADKLTWTASTFKSDVPGVPQRSGPLKVFHWSVDLETPGEIIEAIGFYSSATQPDTGRQFLSGPFLLAVTLE
jgi:hypothetical protein